MSRLIIGNWKMYPTLSDSLVLATSVKGALEAVRGVEVAIAPPTPWLIPIREHWRHRLAHLHLAAQNVWSADQGAFTGEVSAYLLKDIVSYAIVGHSERRESADEDSEQVSEKVQACLKWGITPVVCVGEQKKVLHADGTVNSYHWSRLAEQLLESVRSVTKAKLPEVVIAYEPVWAISSHSPTALASPLYVEQVIARLREKLADKYGQSLANQVRFLYGGSVDGANSLDYLRQREVAGLLVGSASVKAKEFIRICQAAARLG